MLLKKLVNIVWKALNMEGTKNLIPKVSIRNKIKPGCDIKETIGLLKIIVPIFVRKIAYK